MSGATASLTDRVGAALDAPGGPSIGAKVVVAVSGGLDSSALLHLLRFPLRGRVELVVAHFDHASRQDSALDAAWMRGLCAAWSLPLRSARAAEPPASEAAGRAARYAFLEAVRGSEGATHVLTAHHADDQAETVLFRVVRGTGLGGLTGIDRLRDGVVLRPLIDTWRSEIEDYARGARLTWRHDATNAGTDFARNAIRHRILPEAERLVAAGARRSLVRLARLAEVDRAALEALIEDRLGALTVSTASGAVSVDRAALLAEHDAVRTHLLRRLASRFGVALDERGTRLAVEFTSSGRSGSGIDLGGGVSLRRELDRLVVGRAEPEPRPDEELVISGPEPGGGEARLGGRRIRVVWGRRPDEVCFTSTELRLSAGDYPLLVRAGAPGDRIRLHGGAKKLKKILLEARIPTDERPAVPVVVDAGGAILWVPGVARAEQRDGAAGSTFLAIGIAR